MRRHHRPASPNLDRRRLLVLGSAALGLALAACTPAAAPTPSTKPTAAPPSGAPPAAPSPSAAASASPSPAAAAAPAANTAPALPKPEISQFEMFGTRDPQNMAVASLAELSGYFRDEGLTIERRFIASAGEVPNLMASGSAKVASGGAASLIIARGQGVPVYAFFHQGQISGTQGLVVGRKLAAIKEAKELQGLTVGRTQGNMPVEILTGLARELGVDLGTMTFVNLQGAEMVVALDKGDIDLMASFQPFLYNAVKSGGKLIATGNESFWPGREGARDWLPLESLVLVLKPFLDQNPGALTAFARAMLRSIKDIQADVDRAAEKLAPELQIDLEVLKVLMRANKYRAPLDASIDRSFTFTNAFLLRDNRVPRAVETKEALVTTIVGQLDPALVTWP
jgi:ABC-type nitrate/sulfonate/bicarbonate transport system substrate-binding protein